MVSMGEGIAWASVEARHERCGQAGLPAAVPRQASAYSTCRSSLIVVLSRRETGQPVFAFSAAFWIAALSPPGTLTLQWSVTSVIFQPSASFSKLHSAVVSIL